MNELNISTIIGILKKCLWYMVLVAVIFGVLAYCYCSFIATPTYQSKVSFIATNGGFSALDDIPSTNTEDKLYGSDIQASKDFLPTYIDIFKTEGIYKKVIEKTGLDYSARELKKMTSVDARSEDSLFIDVVVTATDPKHAVIIAETIFSIGGEYVVEQLPYAYIKGMERTSGVATQNYPNYSVTIVIAAFFGAVLVFAITIINNLMDKTIKGENDFNRVYDIPILGNIPNFKVATREEKK